MANQDTRILKVMYLKRPKNFASINHEHINYRDLLRFSLACLALTTIAA